MTWAMLLPVIIQYAPKGIAVAEAIWKKWKSGAEPTQTDFDELKALGQQTVRSQFMDGFARAGIAADDPRAVAILAALPA